ncbi:hypothetical protein H4F38_02710 [Pectobacterium brasiliense]|uniref:hypothetical protein n=1 Tax=Pectobacterium brasiliense TaxID=180957 RepID=UPI00094A77FC|nr:hypothetical protein [Pectobacterium brasiliense]APS30999.1 hypothetical protein NC16_15260 [Pectobacterium brasiliense]MBN3096675.1 hypothetical protein [Pectobacterium brasiliense]MBN3101698.1 hypothetical protein [Pectobacterium brasiliense]MBN3163720.1 hypothetical protein [Pectobacterium brasiliense]MBN3180462.1 hypothetical protein [Pectobacterium brasiliense]
MASVYDYERQVFEKEGVRIVIRSDGNGIDLPDYDYQRQASDSTRLSDFLANRIDSTLDDFNLSYSVVSGDGNASVHGNTKLEKLRDSYEK